MMSRAFSLLSAGTTYQGECFVVVALMLDSRNYRLTQHMNKLGKPYEAPSLKDY